MNIIKVSSILFISMFILCAFIPEASARNHYRCRSSFGLSFNAGPVRAYEVVPAPVAVPAPVYTYPYPYYYAPAPVYAPTPVIVQPRVYAQPGFSFSFSRY